MTSRPTFWSAVPWLPSPRGGGAGGEGVKRVAAPNMGEARFAPTRGRTGVPPYNSLRVGAHGSAPVFWRATLQRRFWGRAKHASPLREAGQASPYDFLRVGAHGGAPVFLAGRSTLRPYRGGTGIPPYIPQAPLCVFAILCVLCVTLCAPTPTPPARHKRAPARL